MRIYTKAFCLGFAALLALGCGSQAPTIDIWTAAAAGNTAELQKHIAAGTDLNQKEPAGGGTPLIAASALGQTEAARLLINNGAELEIKNNDGSTALMTAVFFCYPEIVKLLLENGAEVNTTNNAGSTPMDVVGGEWSQELEGIYKMVAGILKMDLDLERIKKVRSSVAEILKKHGGKTSKEL
ncbi:MAG: ankyrin repeat domain-containing protein [Candidatus Omnitrophica bacterium]|nr:ankyrin repeat domain-containing protein [Candidatus Omnitrophota bacterium]